MEGFEIIGPIEAIETIAIAKSIRDIDRLPLIYGQGRWRKLIGVATIRFPDGGIYRAEIHGHELIRVIDESEEDYLFPNSYFIPIELTEEVEQALYAVAPVA